MAIVDYEFLKWYIEQTSNSTTVQNPDGSYTHTVTPRNYHETKDDNVIEGKIAKPQQPRKFWDWEGIE